MKTQVLALTNERKEVRSETEVDFSNMKKGESPENEVARIRSIRRAVP